jgi:CRP/FNR family transcriptional regulator, cyclic AMP receptor protein
MAEERAVALLQQVPIFEGVGPETLDLLARRLRQHRYRRGDVLFRQDEPSLSLHLITSGSVKISRTTEDGDEAVLGLAWPGSCIGEVGTLDGGLRSATVTAAEATETLALLRDDILTVLQGDLQFALALIGSLARRLRNADVRLEDAYFAHLDERVGRRLLQFAEERGRATAEGIDVPLPLSQAELASMLGAGRSRVSTVLGAYQDAGLIRLGKRSFTVLQPERLRQRARREGHEFSA